MAGERWEESPGLSDTFIKPSRRRNSITWIDLIILVVWNLGDTRNNKKKYLENCFYNLKLLFLPLNHCFRVSLTFACILVQPNSNCVSSGIVFESLFNLLIFKNYCLTNCVCVSVCTCMCAHGVHAKHQDYFGT